MLKRFVWLRIHVQLKQTKNSQNFKIKKIENLDMGKYVGCHGESYDI